MQPTIFVQALVKVSVRTSPDYPHSHGISTHFFPLTFPTTFPLTFSSLSHRYRNTASSTKATTTFTNLPNCNGRAQLDRKWPRKSSSERSPGTKRRSFKASGSGCSRRMRRGLRASSSTSRTWGISVSSSLRSEWGRSVGATRGRQMKRPKSWGSTTYRWNCEFILGMNIFFFLKEDKTKSKLFFWRSTYSGFVGATEKC